MNENPKLNFSKNNGSKNLFSTINSISKTNHFRICIIHMIIVLSLCTSSLFAQNSWADKHNKKKTKKNALTYFGDAMLVVLPTIMNYNSSRHGNGNNARLNTFANITITYGLKYGLNKVKTKYGYLGDRPNGGDKNFPSAHASTTCNAAYYSLRTEGRKIGLPMMLLAGITSYSRVYGNYHTPSATITGCTLGIAVAEISSRSIPVSINVSDADGYVLNYSNSF